MLVTFGHYLNNDYRYIHNEQWWKSYGSLFLAYSLLFLALHVLRQCYSVMSLGYNVLLAKLRIMLSATLVKARSYLDENIQCFMTVHAMSQHKQRQHLIYYDFFVCASKISPFRKKVWWMVIKKNVHVRKSYRYHVLIGYGKSELYSMHLNNS